MRRSNLIICLGIVCALLTFPAVAGAARPAPAAPQVTVSGTVVETAGPPIAGATVEVAILSKGVYVAEATVTTAADGTWSYGGKKGSYRFVFTAAGADSATVYAVYNANGTYTLTTALQCYGSIAGIVSDSVTGLPIGGATVEFFAAVPGGGWSSTPAATLIAPDGAHTSPQLPTGAYAVRATAPGYAAAYFGGSAPTAVAVSRAATTAATDVALAPVPAFGSISGRVVSGAAETPMGEAFVYLYKQNADGTWPPTYPYWGSPTVTLNTDTLGNYASGDIPLGNWRVRFFTVHTGSQWWQYVATVDLATPVTLTTPGQAITGIDGWFGKP